MTPCQFCGQPATVHLTDILGNVRRESHLCEACAREHHLIPEGDPAQIDVQAIVQMVVGAVKNPRRGGPDPDALVCPSCGIGFPEFRATGRLGCAHDYTAFAAPLERLLEKVHRATAHGGKMPKSRVAANEREKCRAELDAAVAAEDYERAAVLRDRIRQKEDPG